MMNTAIFASKLEGQGYPVLDDATKHPNLIGTSLTVVSEEYLKKFPDFPKIWNEARQKALKDLQPKPEEYPAERLHAEVESEGYADRPERLDCEIK